MLTLRSIKWISCWSESLVKLLLRRNQGLLLDLASLVIRLESFEVGSLVFEDLNVLVLSLKNLGGQYFWLLNRSLTAKLIELLLQS